MESNNSTVSEKPKFTLRNSNGGPDDPLLTTAIKKGDVKSFIKKGAGPSDLNQGGKDQENLGLQAHLLQLKKSCSDLSKEIKMKEANTDKYKDETAFTIEKKNKMKDEREKFEAKLAELQKNFDQVNSKKNTAMHSSKTYEHILERMKKDNIHHQLRKNQLALELKGLEKNLNITTSKQYQLVEMEKLSQFGVKDAEEEYKDQQQSRRKKLNSIEESNAKKKQINEKLRARQNQTEQIQQMAAGDLQDADLMRLKKFLTVQMFLKELLKSKISRLKKYFEPYQIAFYQIKSRTHVKDSNSLKNQFFNFESVYTGKTEWVKILQSELSSADAERKKLKEKLKEVMNEEIQILGELQQRNQNNSNNLDAREVSEKSIEYELAWQRISSWINFQSKKVNVNIQGMKMEEALKQICKNLKLRKQAKAAEQEEKNKNKKNEEDKNNENQKKEDNEKEDNEQSNGKCQEEAKDQDKEEDEKKSQKEQDKLSKKGSQKHEENSELVQQGLS